MNSQFVVGIDVGGQTTKLGVVDARGTVLAQTVIRTDTYTDVEPYIAELAEALNKIIKESDAKATSAESVSELLTEIIIQVQSRMPLTFLGVAARQSCFPSFSRMR